MDISEVIYVSSVFRDILYVASNSVFGISSVRKFLYIFGHIQELKLRLLSGVHMEPQIYETMQLFNMIFTQFILSLFAMLPLYLLAGGRAHIIVVLDIE